jgi:hypothetical protein
MRSAAELRHDLNRFLASVHQGAPSTAQPDVASGHDRSTVVAVACPGRRATGPPGRLRRQATATPSAPPTDPNRRPSRGRPGRGRRSRTARPPATRAGHQPRLGAGLDRDPGDHDQPVDHQPGTGHTASPSTTLTGTSPPATTRQTTTTSQAVGPGQRIVPDVVGLHRQQAADVLAQAQLGTQVVPTQVSDSGQVQRVVAQQPSAGHLLPAGSEVTVLVGTRRPTA